MAEFLAPLGQLAAASAPDAAERSAHDSASSICLRTHSFRTKRLQGRAQLVRPLKNCRQTVFATSPSNTKASEGVSAFSREATSTPNFPRSQCSQGRVKVRFAWFKASTGTRSRTDSARRAFGAAPFLALSGRAAMNSTNRWSRKGTRTSKRMAHAHRIGIAQKRVQHIRAQLEIGSHGLARVRFRLGEPIPRAIAAKKPFPAGPLAGACRGSKAAAIDWFAQA